MERVRIDSLEVNLKSAFRNPPHSAIPNPQFYWAPCSLRYAYPRKRSSRRRFRG